MNGTTAHNRPHKSAIHYSGKGYDEYRADLMNRLEAQGFVLRDDDFINAFVDLTAYLGEVLMTYQNAYAQEIYLETAQLRETLFNLAAVVDYRIDPGGAATGTLVVQAKPEKSGLLPKGFQVSGKDEGAKKAVFFETDADLNVDVAFNDFTLAESERFNDLALGTSLTVLQKMTVRPGQYIYFHSSQTDLFAQVQTAAVDESAETTTLSWNSSSQFQYPVVSANVGDGAWGLVNPEGRGLLYLSGSTVWLDGKYENISMGAPLVLKKKDTADCYGTITSVEFQLATVKTGEIRWISQNAAAAGEVEEYHYTIKVQENGSTVDKTFYALKKDVTEAREATNLGVTWLGTSPANYPASPKLKSPDHTVYAGIGAAIEVRTREENDAPLNGERMLEVDGDFTAMEKYRTLILHEDIAGTKTIETATLLKVTPVGAGSRMKSQIELKSAISNSFTRYGVSIWGNAVAMTQGKSAATQILGSGQGDASYQTFALPQSPLTYERRGREGIKPAVDIRVGDLPWEEREDFLESGPEDRHYVVETGYDGKSRVVFGDGANGARIPTGLDNVKASFRIGQGTEGNVSAGVLKKPTSKPPFLKEVSNPEETAGGSDPDTEAQLREKIPVEHLTFDRAVSLSDYADLALAYPGVGKAKAGWRWINNRHVVYLAVAGEEGGAVAPILEDLRDYLDARRDVNQPLLVKEVCRVPVSVTMDVIVCKSYDLERVKDALYQALGTGKNDDGSLQFFNFDRLAIGMSIHKKDLYRVAEQVAGVKKIATLAMARSACTAETDYMLPAFCAEDIWIYNWELAELDTAALAITVSHPEEKALCVSRKA